MLVGDRVTYDAVNEAYCLLSAYIREDGTIAANYNIEDLKGCIKFLSEILKHPENFVETERKPKEARPVAEHDGLGLA